MPYLRSILIGFLLASLGLSFSASEAIALQQDSRTGAFKPITNSPYRFGYSPKINTLPGTKPKKKCIPHGLARCSIRPRAPSPFAAQVSRRGMDSNHPLIKRNQPFRPEPVYEVSE